MYVVVSTATHGEATHELTSLIHAWLARIGGYIAQRCQCGSTFPLEYTNMTHDYVQLAYRSAVFSHTPCGTDAFHVSRINRIEVLIEWH